MILDVLGAFSLILSLFLSMYNIRSLAFFRTAKKMIRQNKSLHRNNNYSSSSVFNIGPEHNSYRYHDDARIDSDKDAGNANDDNSNNKMFIQSINNALSYNNGKEITPKKEKLWYNNTNDYNNIIGHSPPPTSPAPHVAPFISILVPARNERLVIDHLMRSCAALTYNQDNFEIVVVDDDSQDGTYDAVRKWTDKIQNLKVIRRSDRTEGWKGGVLNLALNNINTNSSYVLVVDADNILANDILERFVSCFTNSSEEYERNGANVIQGYPRPWMYSNSIYDLKRKSSSSIRGNANWIARAIDFRLAQR